MTWELYLVRTFTLFSTSLWNLWYDSPQMEEIWGIRFKHALMIEEREEVVRCYRYPNDLRLYAKSTAQLIGEEEKLHTMLQRGEHLNEQAIAYIEGKETIDDFEEAVSFYIDLALYSAALPRYTLQMEGETMRADSVEIAERLRANSYFPTFGKVVLVPIVQKMVREKGFDPDFANLLTVEEIRTGRFTNALTRKRSQRFIYEYHNGQETVMFVDNPAKKIRELEPEIQTTSSVEGKTAFPGKVRGTVRIINTLNLNVPFNEGDVLVTISSSPLLMPLIRKAGAIVSDEGGIGSHANIISRELEIPCVIGTKNASLVFKDGDKVEVDADKGIVRKL